MTLSKKQNDAIVKELQSLYEDALWYSRAYFDNIELSSSDIRKIANNNNIKLKYYCPA